MPKTEHWLSPLNRALWVRAFKARHPQVRLRDGRVFNITYSKMKQYASEPRANNFAFAAPAGESYVPCGYFHLDKILGNPEIWIYESSVEDKSPGGIYYDFVTEFVRSGLAGIDVTEHWPELEGREAATLRNGFSKAIELKGKAAQNVKVFSREGKVYLAQIEDEPDA